MNLETIKNRNWRDLAPLLSGTERQQSAASTLANSHILEILAPFDAVLCGTIPIDCDVPSSDLDIICTHECEQGIYNAMTKHFADADNFILISKNLHGTPSVICRFTLDKWPVEIVSQPLPVTRQRAYGHMLAEASLLEGADQGTNDQIRTLKLSGLSTEEAFARHFGIPGDPYIALFELYEREFVQ